MMKKGIVYLWVGIFFAACDFTPDQTVRINGEFPIHGESRVELTDEQSGKQVASLSMENGKLDVTLDSIPAGIYRLTIRWPRTLVSPKERISRIKDRVQGVKPEHALQKNLYIDPGSACDLELLPEGITQPTLERYLWENDPRLALVVRSTNADAQVFEGAEHLLNYHRLRHKLERDSLKKIVYQSTSDEQRYRAIYQQMNGLWTNKFLPELVEAQKALMREHPNSVVIPYLIYRSVRNASEFEPYREIYEGMGEQAQKSVYTKALQKFAASQ